MRDLNKTFKQYINTATSKDFIQILKPSAVCNKRSCEKQYSLHKTKAFAKKC